MFPSDSRIPLSPPLHCKTCGKVFKGLGCPACLMAKSVAEITRQQATYVPMAVEGRITVTLCRWRAGEFHVALYGNLLRSFCGESLKGATRVRVPYSQINKPYETCQDCMNMFRQSLVESMKERGIINADNVKSELDGGITELTKGSEGVREELPPWSDES